MNRKTLVVVSILIILGVVGISIIELVPLKKIIPDTTEAKEIMKTVEKAYQIEAKAARNFDPRDFPTVFINDSRFPIYPVTLQVVREMTNNLSLESAGYLDYKLAFYSWWREGALHREELQKKAKSENRELSKEERKSLTDAYGRVAFPRREGAIQKKNYDLFPWK